MRRTLDELQSPNIKVNFDPANMLLYDMGDPQTRSSCWAQTSVPCMSRTHGDPGARHLGTGSTPGPRRGRYSKIHQQLEIGGLSRAARHRTRGGRSGGSPRGRGPRAGVPARMSLGVRRVRRSPNPGGRKTFTADSMENSNPRRIIVARSFDLGSFLTDDRIDNFGKLAPSVGQGVEIMLACAARLDQPSMPQEREVMAHRGLALRAKVGHSSDTLPLSRSGASELAVGWGRKPA